MANFRKVLTSAAVFSLTVLVMAACAPKEIITDLTVVGQTDADSYSEGPITMQVNEAMTLEGRLRFDDDTTRPVEGAIMGWSSENEAAVSVTATGIITAHEPTLGVEITGTYRGFSDDIVIIVVPAELP